MAHRGEMRMGRGGIWPAVHQAMADFETSGEVVYCDPTNKAFDVPHQLTGF